jgi:hypothetical protein
VVPAYFPLDDSSEQTPHLRTISLAPPQRGAPVASGETGPRRGFSARLCRALGGLCRCPLWWTRCFRPKVFNFTRFPPTDRRCLPTAPRWCCADPEGHPQPMRRTPPHPSLGNAAACACEPR